MSSGKEFQRTDAAAGNERRPTVDHCICEERSKAVCNRDSWGRGKYR